MLAHQYSKTLLENFRVSNFRDVWLVGSKKEPLERIEFLQISQSVGQVYWGLWLWWKIQVWMCGPHCVMKRDKRKYVRIKTRELVLTFPLPDVWPWSSKVCVFSRSLRVTTFLGFRNRYPEMHDPSWFWQLFVFSLNPLIFVCLISRNTFCK